MVTLTEGERIAAIDTGLQTGLSDLMSRILP